MMIYPRDVSIGLDRHQRKVGLGAGFRRVRTGVCSASIPLVAVTTVNKKRLRGWSRRNAPDVWERATDEQD